MRRNGEFLSTMLLASIPVYPGEATIKDLAVKSGKKVNEVRRVLLSLPAACPLAERGEAEAICFCFPSAEAKERALSRSFPSFGRRLQ